MDSVSARTACGWRSGFLRTSAPTFVVDETGTIRFWNDAAWRLTGYPREEVLGKRCSAVLCGRQGGRSWCGTDCRVRRLVKRGELPDRASVEVRARNGRRIPVRMTFIVQQEPHGKTIAHVLEDASPQVELRQTLEEVRRLVGESDGRSSLREPAAELSSRFENVGPARPDLSALTRREVETLRLLVEGFSTEDVGRRLGVSPLTARNHIQHAVRKLGAHNRAQAVAAVLAQDRP